MLETLLEGVIKRPLSESELREIVAGVATAIEHAAFPGTSVDADSTQGRLAGLSAPVQVRFGTEGTAHIVAETAFDVYLAQGYLTAGDRLWQMDFLRRVAAGRAAEILGISMLESDKYFLPFGFLKIAQEAMQSMRADMAEALEAYAQGVNQRIERFRAGGWPPEFNTLEYEPESWSAIDSLLVTKLQAEALSCSWLNDILRQEFLDLPETLRQQLFPGTSPLDLVVFGDDAAPERGAQRTSISIENEKVPVRSASISISGVVRYKKVRAEALRLASLYSKGRAASNNWVLSGQRTMSGSPILANDPHLQVSVPGTWHMAHLTCAGLDVAGVTIPGVPGILIGHNADLAWGVTNVGADVQDLVRVERTVGSADEYSTPAGIAQVEQSVIPVRIRTGSASWEVLDLVVRSTLHGPVVFESDQHLYALSWPALDPENHDLPAFYDLNRASNFKEARAALAAYRGPPQNVVIACRDGDIGAQIAGCVVKRQAGSTGGLPVDGSTVEYQTPGLLAFDCLPWVHNPDSGIIVTANNRIVGLDFPQMIARDWAAPYRARRIFDLLTAIPRSDIDFSLKVQADTFSFADANFVAEVLRMARKMAIVDDRWRALIQIFSEWEGSTEASSVATTVSAYMRRTFTRRILAKELDKERIETYLRWDVCFQFVDSIIVERPKAWLPDPFLSYEQLVLASFDEAVHELSMLAGTDPSRWQWGAVADAVEFVHPLSVLFPTTENSIRYRFPRATGGGGPTVNAGAEVSMRFIADLSDWDLTRMGLPLGQSGDVRSAHFEDQLPSWLGVKPPVFVFTSAAKATLNVELKWSPDNIDER